MIYSKIIKKAFDTLMAIILLIGLAPFLFLIVLILFFTQGSSIIFIQKRSGLNLKPFSVYKFRTLAFNGNSTLSMENRRFTKTGKFFRRTGLDELPQLINVLKGDMSIVGPRPMPLEYESFYFPEHLKRFEVSPGITGLAQVNGKNNITWRRRFDLDCLYAINLNLKMDLKILWMTIIQFFSLLSDTSEHEMPVFTGKNLD